MKKITIILLTVFYFTVASGITVSFHYCGGKFKEISLFHTNSEEGCCGSKEKSKGCCNEKTTFIKVKDNHFSNNNVTTANNQFKILDVVLPIDVFEFPNASFLVYYTLNYHAPPVFCDNPLYLKHRALLL